MKLNGGKVKSLRINPVVIRENFRQIFLLFTLMFFIAAPEFFAQSVSPSLSPTPSLEKRFLTNVLKDQYAIWTSPLHLQRGDVRWLA